MGATRLFIKLMTQKVGDGDAVYLAYPHLRTLLDVGLTTAEIETLSKEPESKPLLPLLQYALSVGYARAQNYAKADVTSAELDLTKIPNFVLGSYYKYSPYFWNQSPESHVAEVQKQMQAMLTEQRQRWKRLKQWQQENTPDSQYRIASDWAGKGGWKNGYMAIWDGGRAVHLPRAICETLWVCNTKRRNPNVVRKAYQNSSQNAIAVSLYQKLLDDPRITSGLREKTLYMVAATLLMQWENHPVEETVLIHPPAGVQGKPQNFDIDYSNNHDNYMQQDYQRRIDRIIDELSTLR